jgi:hypothetical protein
MAFIGSRKRPISVSEKEYFESGDWKCPKSPTGGHWWNCNIQPFICKICGKVKVHTPPQHHKLTFKTKSMFLVNNQDS